MRALGKPILTGTVLFRYRGIVVDPLAVANDFGGPRPVWRQNYRGPNPDSLDTFQGLDVKKVKYTLARTT